MTTELQALEEFIRSQLANYRRAYEAGVMLALRDALESCSRENFPPEPWMIDATLDFIDQHIGKTATGRGRSGNPIAKYANDLVHYARWDAVTTVREQQKIDQNDRERLAQLEMPEKKRREIEDMLNAGTTFQDAVKGATELLRGTRAYGSPRTIDASYWLVVRAMKDPEQHGRFYVVSPQTLSRFDIEI